MPAARKDRPRDGRTGQGGAETAALAPVVVRPVRPPGVHHSLRGGCWPYADAPRPTPKPACCWGAAAPGVRCRISWTTCSAVRRLSWAWAVGSRRWARTATARACTSSGSAYSRPLRAADAFAARSRCSVARGEAPSLEVGVGARGGDQVHGVPPDRVGDVDAPDRLDQLQDLVRVRHRLQVVQWVHPAVHVEHLQLGVRAGIADGDPRHEAVALGLRQRVGALHLDRVLRRHHHEGAGQLVGLAVDGDLALLHRLEQRGLRLRGGAVDLVADHHLREDRAGLELEVPALLVPDGHPGDVRGQQVRRELDPAHGAVDGPGQRLGQHGLSDPRDVLDQQMALGEQHGQREPYDSGSPRSRSPPNRVPARPQRSDHPPRSNTLARGAPHGSPDRHRSSPGPPSAFPPLLRSGGT